MAAKIVCIFDDEEEIRIMYKKKLEQRGLEVCEAFNGPTALEQVKKHNPDCILLDILMPGMSGMEVLRQLKKNKETKNIPVLILSNLSADIDIRNAIDSKADGYFVKMHFTPDEIVDKVEDTLKNNRKK